MLINTQQVAYNFGMNALNELIRQQKMFSISSFEYNETKFNFRVPYKLGFSFDGKHYYHENDELEIYAREEKLEDLLIEVYDSIYCLWKGYAEKKDSELSKGAIELKNTLKKMIEVS